MSNPWAIAAVSAVMRHTLRQQLDAATSGGIIHDVDVVVQPLDQVKIDDTTDSRLNLFLYEITSNAALSNDHLPMRNGGGNLVNTPQLALNLRYLMIACGTANFENEILLGHGLQAFSKSPSFSRHAIRNILDPTLPEGSGVPPQAFRQQAVAVAEQFELLKVTPVFLRSEEMSKIWSGLQSTFRPCVVLEVTAVIVEEPLSVTKAQPVLRLGDSGRGWEAQANLFSTSPILWIARAPNSQPATLANGILTLIGSGLNGTATRVRLRQDRLGHSFTVSGAAITRTPAVFSAAEIAANPDLRLATHLLAVNLSSSVIEGTATAAPWAAGIYSVEVFLTLPAPRGEASSNQLSAAIAPAFVTSGGNAPAVAVNGSNLQITLNCSPPVRARQSATIIVGDFEFPALLPDVDTAVAVFISPVPSEMRGTTQLLRLRIDGVDSLYINRSFTPPVFAAGHTVNLPA
jgi:Pvc16 N-terminal domain